MDERQHDDAMVSRVRSTPQNWRLKVSVLDRTIRPRRHVLVSRRHSFVYFQVPKVATRSLLEALRETDEDSVEHNKVSTTPLSFRGLRSFAFVRDPYDRLYSCWANKVRDSDQFALFYPQLDGASFEQFVMEVATWDLRVCDAHVRLQSRLVPRRLDFVGRFERLNEDYAALTDWLGVPHRPLPIRNSSKATESSDTSPYTPALRSLVADLYADDLARFRYPVAP